MADFFTAHGEKMRKFVKDSSKGVDALNKKFTKYGDILKEIGTDFIGNNAEMERYIKTQKNLLHAVKEFKAEQEGYTGFFTKTHKALEYFMTTADPLPKFLRRIAFGFLGLFRPVNQLSVQFKVLGKIWDNTIGSILTKSPRLRKVLGKLNLGKLDAAGGLKKAFKGMAPRGLKLGTTAGKGASLLDKTKGLRFKGGLKKGLVKAKDDYKKRAGAAKELMLERGRGRRAKIGERFTKIKEGAKIGLARKTKVKGYTRKKVGAGGGSIKVKGYYRKNLKYIKKMEFLSKLGGKIKMFFGLSITILSKMFNFFVMSMLFFGAIGLVIKIVKDFWPAIQAFWDTVSKPFMEFGQIVIDMFMNFWNTIKTIWGFFTGENTFEEMAFSMLDSLFGILKTWWSLVSKVFWPMLKGVGNLLIKAGAILWEKFTDLSGWKMAGVAIGILGAIVLWLYGIPIIFPLIIIGALFMVARWFLDRFTPFASGGVSAGGMSIVGEGGPELVKLPSGSRVHSNAQSRKMLSAGGSVVNNFNITVNARDTSDGEMRRIANQIGDMVNSKINRTTSSRTMG
jgi:hypothetical protein